ncbi:peroxin [Mactra antiquata]
MFYRMWNFIKRHKKKFIFTAVVLVGGRYFYRYAAEKLKDFQDKEAAECLAHARRQHHFDSNQRTCNMTVLSMIPTLRDQLQTLLNTEEITELLKSNPSDKVQLWDDLKILAFCRVIAVVYTYTLMSMMLRVQLNIIGGYMYVENLQRHQGISANTSISVTPTEVQEQYLGLIREFFDKGVPKLVAQIKEAVYKEIQSYSLKENFTLHNLEAVIKHIRERLENGREVSLKEIPTIPLCDYLMCWKDNSQINEQKDEQYIKLLAETEDILQSYDFHTVFSTALNKGFAKLMDYFAEFYQPSHRNDSSIQLLTEVSIPLAKIIPYSSGLLYKLGSDAPNPLVQELFLLEPSKTLAANIYEAFSQYEEADDPQLMP